MSAARRGAGFLAAGAIAFATDAAVLAALTRGFAIDPFSARIAAIGVAMTAGYFAHRKLTFAVATPPSLPEFGKFITVAATAALVNYGIYAGVLIARPGVEPLLALLFATAIAMVVTFVGLKLGVFHKRS